MLIIPLFGYGEYWIVIGERGLVAWEMIFVCGGMRSTRLTYSSDYGIVGGVRCMYGLCSVNHSKAL